jgi:hypothetical protein
MYSVDPFGTLAFYVAEQGTDTEQTDRRSGAGARPHKYPSTPPTLLYSLVHFDRRTKC